MSSFSLRGLTKQWIGINPGLYSGNLWATWNIDLERVPGRILMSPHMTAVSSQSEALGVVHKMIRTNATTTEQWFALVRATTSAATDGDMLRNGNATITSGTWATDDTSASPNNVHDMVIHEYANGEERLFATVATDIAVLNTAGAANIWDIDWGSTIATGGQALSSTVYHPIARLQRLVAIGDVSSNVAVIHTIDKDDVFTPNRLTFGAQYVVRNIYTSSNRFWFGLQNVRDGAAKIIEWDGFSLTYNNEYEIEGNVPLTGFVINNVPYFVNEKGFILKFSGGGFEVDKTFLLEEQDLQFTVGSISATVQTDPTGNSISDYGAFVDGHRVYFNLSTPGGGLVLSGARRTPSGIWVYNTKTNNLYHNRGLGDRRVSATPISFGAQSILKTGCVFKATVSAEKLLFAGASVYTGGASYDSTSRTILFRDRKPTGTGVQRAHFITPYLSTGDVEAMWDSLRMKLRRFFTFANSTGNTIVVKWRVRDPLVTQGATNLPNEYFFPPEATATWVSTTTFTCAVPTGVGVGDEVEVLAGDNSGCTFAISALSATPDSSTSITVTIAEAAPFSSTSGFKARFDNWRTETSLTSSTVDSWRFPLTTLTTGGAGNAQGPFIQFKVELRGLGVEIDDLIPVHRTKTAIEQA